LYEKFIYSPPPPHPRVVFVRALWSRICEILIGSRIVTHHLQKRKGEKKEILLNSSSLLETPTLVSFFLANVRTMMKFTKFLLLGLLIGLFAGISVPSSA
jgi:hypothetical protein|tara:strand:- start:157 stop:456 length:300 start_codon:yes stop_codon:yes gene_type:complete